MSIIKNHGEPTVTTIGNVGDFYIDLDANTVYQCIDVKTPGDEDQFVTTYSRTAFNAEYIWAGGVVDLEPQYIQRTLTELSDDTLESVGAYAFAWCAALTRVNLSNVTTVKHHAFYSCDALIDVNLPAAKTIDDHGFSYSDGLVEIKLPVAETLGANVFAADKKLGRVDLPAVLSIGATSFANCSVLTALILRNTTTVCALGGSLGNGVNGGLYIYVPSALIEEYKVADNWSTYAAQFRALEDYTVDASVTGELDSAKIA